MHTQLVHEINASSEDIYAQLFDFQKFGAAHPYMKKVTLLQEISPTTRLYDVKEEVLFFGCIKTKPSYDVTVFEIEAGKKLRYHSRIQKYIDLQIDFTLLQNSDKKGFIIQEDISIKAIYLARVLFLNILKPAHLKTFARLKELLEPISASA